MFLLLSMFGASLTSFICGYIFSKRGPIIKPFGKPSYAWPYEGLIGFIALIAYVEVFGQLTFTNLLLIGLSTFPGIFFFAKPPVDPKVEMIKQMDEFIIFLKLSILNEDVLWKLIKYLKMPQHG